MQEVVLVRHSEPHEFLLVMNANEDQIEALVCGARDLEWVTPTPTETLVRLRMYGCYGRMDGEVVHADGTTKTFVLLLDDRRAPAEDDEYDEREYYLPIKSMLALIASMLGAQSARLLSRAY